MRHLVSGPDHYTRPPDAFDDFTRHRKQMIAAWHAWIATQPLPADVEIECNGTQRAMRSIQDVLGDCS
jgi:hypothetical protein